ncbi:DUF262 domain-containing protein [Limosilactobacillus sp. c10Ua_36]|uniref:DUF262 domain-containing protein n=1 Tax=Limosilactobacillus sp. c10Ua_36 TaxID=2775910 RepID=UPI002DD6823F|nr:DUF262 domain-containing protein [Limosilactobacillus sp. c10Ua_36]MEC4742313.1 DUF262 domain-containing protein [Limosilactobacillus sp. c10Ua_36]
MEKEKIIKANTQIKKLQKQISYDTRDYPIDYLVNNYDNQTFYSPNYQRNADVWDLHRKARFIESLLLGYPIPMLFLSDTKTGKLEIVDGLQRISTLSEFLKDELKLDKLEKLTELNDFTFSNLPEDEQFRLKAYSLRVIVLRRDTDEATRIDLFNRINTSSLIASPSEIRSGSELLNPFMKIIKELAKKKVFLELVELSSTKKQREEDIELVSRFFAYSHNYHNFKHRVNIFVDDFVKQFREINLSTDQKNKYREEFINTFNFIRNNYPVNVFKNSRNQTPRVRFEAISVGTNLALKENSHLNIKEQDIKILIENQEFKKLTTSDGSNSRKRVIQRIEFVKNYLLKCSERNERTA